MLPPCLITLLGSQYSAQWVFPSLLAGLGSSFSLGSLAGYLPACIPSHKVRAVSGLHSGRSARVASGVLSQGIVIAFSLRPGRRRSALRRLSCLLLPP